MRINKIDLSTIKDPSMIGGNDCSDSSKVCDNFKSMKLQSSYDSSIIQPGRKQKHEDNCGRKPTHLRQAYETTDGLIRGKSRQTFDISLNRGDVLIPKVYQNRRMGRVNKPTKNMADASRRRNDHSAYGRVHIPPSEYYFELNAFDEEICKRTATRAYATQICMEGDRDVATCLGLSAMAHDQALFEHANYVHASMVSSRQSNVLEWLKSRTDEEQRQYLNYHKQGI